MRGEKEKCEFVWRNFFGELKGNYEWNYQFELC